MCHHIVYHQTLLEYRRTPPFPLLVRSNLHLLLVEFKISPHLRDGFVADREAELLRSETFKSCRTFSAMAKFSHNRRHVPKRIWGELGYVRPRTPLENSLDISFDA